MCIVIMNGGEQGRVRMDRVSAIVKKRWFVHVKHYRVKKHDFKYVSSFSQFNIRS